MAETGGSGAGRARWRALGLYQKFEHVVLLVLPALIAVVIVAAVWHLTLKILFSLVIAEQTVVLLAMRAMVRQPIILDLAATDALHLFGLAAAMAALGAVYWSVREQDRRDRHSTAEATP
jgi:uncharacterized membrane protein (DUF373 family)